MKHKLLPINWVDGMKMNKTHFQHLDSFNSEQQEVYLKTQLRSYNYGIVCDDRNDFGLELDIMEDQLSIKKLIAILPSGVRIDIDKKDDVKIDIHSLTNANVQNGDMLITLTVNPESKVPVGEPNAEELPPRQPYLRPQYNFDLIAQTEATQVFSMYTLPICRVINRSGRYELDSLYLPPCAQSIAQNALLDRYDTIVQKIGTIGADATQVVQKARSKKRRGEINDLAENTFYLVEKVVFYLAQHIHEIRTIRREDSPVFLIAFCNSFGRVILTSLKCLKSEDREALLRYYESHVGLKPHQFESEMRDLSQIEYRHMQLNEVFDQVDRYLDTLGFFMNKAMNLEFHSVERVDVIKETTVKKSKLDIF